MRIGVLGGTFDPVHLGHLVVAEEVRLHLELDEVIFLPTGQPWMKAGQKLSPGEHRLNMVRLAVACNPFFRVSPLEIERPGPTYTADSLRDFCSQLGDGCELYFIMGTDSFTSFLRWKEPGEVLALCTLAVVRRPGTEECDVGKLDTLYAGASRRVVQVPAPLIDLSGTGIRYRAARGESVRYHVPGVVAQYIRRHRLYQGEEEIDERS